MKQVTTSRESGNVLFLILIAVALFAALSYAVTSSTRSGGGSTEREQSLLGSASLTQYPTALRTAVIRMILAGHDVRTLLFDAPSNFGAFSTFEKVVFHPDGGGAVFQQAPGDVMVSGADTDWTHNAELNVPLIGRDGTGGNDLIAFMVGINQATCERINTEMGIGNSGSGECGSYEGNVPEVDITTNTDITENMETGYVFPSSPADTIECTGGTADAFSGKATGCFFDPDLPDANGSFVFYSVILER